MKFSQRIGKTNIRKTLQVESIDERLENRLWNTILDDFFYKFKDRSDDDLEQVCFYIWTEFFCNRKDEIPQYGFNTLSTDTSKVISYIKEWFFKVYWYEIYDFIEFIAEIDNKALKFGFIKSCNDALKKEMAGYRIIDESIVQITSEEEVAEIEEAIDNSSIWEPVNVHLKTAIEYLADREHPDYRNSVKESISSIEALVGIISGEQNLTLGQALNKIEEKYPIHGALKNAFSSLYGYTSDSGGIRHSLTEDDIDVSMEDAKFMLVTCSAFINYLKAKIDKEKIN